MTHSIPLMPDIEPDIIFTNAYFTHDHQPAVYWQLNQNVTVQGVERGN